MGLTVGVVGLGRIGARWEFEDKLRLKPATHAAAWKMTPGVNRVWLADSDPDKIKAENQPAALSELPYGFSTPEGIAEEGCDIVSVATPAETHIDVVKKLLESKPPKVIFCEKPLATTMEDARFIVDECNRKGTKLAVNHTRRWDPVWRRFATVLKSLPKDDKPTMAIGHFTGDLMNVGVHMADLVNWYGLGSVAEVFGHRDLQYLLFELEVFFSSARFSVRDNGACMWFEWMMDSQRYDGVKELHSEYEPDVLIQASAFPGGQVFGSPMLQACKQLVRCIDQGETPYCTGVDGLLALERALSWGQKGQ